MQKLFILILILLQGNLLHAQQQNGTITGHIQDQQNKGLAGISVALYPSTTTNVLKMVISDSAGQFAFPAIPLGNYRVVVSGANMQQQELPVTVMADRITQALLFHLSTSGKVLQNVLVGSKKPLIEQQLDRMIVNVDGAAGNVGATALEVLEKSPGVTVDKDGNISLKGKSSVMVMLDGKPSYLSATELASLLGTMSASQLSQIEIMTNPGAKYDAAGNAGVINIKTKKLNTVGFNGSVGVSYGQGVYAKSNNNLSLNYRTKSLNLFMNGGYSINNGFLNLDINRNFFNASGLKSSSLEQAAHRINQQQNGNLKLGLDWYLQPQTTMGWVISGFLAPQQQTGLTNTLVKNGTGNLTGTERTDRLVDNSWKNGSVNMNFKTSFNSNKQNLLANVDYLTYDFSGNQQIAGNSYDATGMLIQLKQQQNILPLNIRIFSVRADYDQPIGNGWKMETGLKASSVKTENASNFFLFRNNLWTPDTSLTNGFRYQENIYAAYLDVQGKIGKWNLQAGLRLENTQYHGLQNTLVSAKDSSFEKNYTSLFPSLFVGYDINDKHQLLFSVSRRIDRPAYQELNPFLSIVDKYTYSSGNPFLQPQFSTNIELSHSYNHLFTTTINYSVIRDMINETLTHSDSVIVRSVGNIGTRYNYGITENIQWQPRKWYQLSFFANLYQNEYDGAINGIPFSASQLTLTMNMSQQFSWGKGWTAELSGNYTSRNRDEGQAIILPAGQLTIALSKSVLNNKGSIKFNVRDIFYTQNPKEIQNFQDVQSDLRISRDSRVFNLAFSYRFGSSAKPKSPAALPTEEQQRIKLN